MVRKSGWSKEKEGHAETYKRQQLVLFLICSIVLVLTILVVIAERKRETEAEESVCMRRGS